MFIGHYGVSVAAKRVDPSIPLWGLFVAVQVLDVFWAPFVLLGIEKVRIAPGITASNPLDLYYTPYTHSLLAALLWSASALLAYSLLGPRRGKLMAALVRSRRVWGGGSRVRPWQPNRSEEVPVCPLQPRSSATSFSAYRPLSS